MCVCVCVREREGEMLFYLTKHRDYFLASFQSVTNKQNISFLDFWKNHFQIYKVRSLSDPVVVLG